MIDRRLTDAQIAAGLRAHLPAQAQVGLPGRIAATIEDTPQQRALPSFLGLFTDIDPARARRNLLLAAMLSLALAGAAVAVAGAVRFMERQTAPPFDETVEIAPPGDLQALALSTYDRMPDLPPLSFTTIQDGTIKGRVMVSDRPAARIERYASLEATEPDTYQILTPAGTGELAAVGDERVWVDQPFTIEEDPRVFVLGATEGTAASQYKPGCEFTRAEIGGPDGSAGAGWHYVGAEMVIGRPTWHITCGEGDVWIDVETRLILRSRGPAIDPVSQTTLGRTTTVEVADLIFGSPPDELFDLKVPPGVDSMTPEAYQCASQPGSCATFAPQPTLPADLGAGPLPSTPPSGWDNGWIAYSTSPRIPASTDVTTGSDIYLVRKGQEPRLIAGRADGQIWNVCPAFSPDGTRLAYGVMVDGARSIAIQSMAPSGPIGDPVNVQLGGSGSPVCPRWSIDGTLIDADGASISGLDTGFPLVSRRDPIDASALVPTVAPDEPLLSPSGSWVARLVDCQLVVERPDGDDPHGFPITGCPYAVAGWSPDGRHVLLMQDLGSLVIHDISMDDGSDSQLATAEVNGARSWSRAGDVSWQPVSP